MMFSTTRSNRFFNARKMLFHFLTTISFLLFTDVSFGQAVGDYRSAASTAWNLPATWERFDGAIWQPNPTPPSSADGVITIQSPHAVNINSAVTADQIIIASGAMLNVGFTLTIADGIGDDLVVNGSLTSSSTIQGDGSIVVNTDFVMSGIVQGAGSLTVNGNTTWNSGTLDRALTNQAGRILSIGTSNSKTLLAPLVNDGTINWTDGFMVLNVAAGSSFTNNGMFTMNGPLFQDNGGIGSFINNSTITKTSAGLLALNSFNVTNSGTININAGSITRSGGSFTNTGTINLSAATFTNSAGTFHHNAGSMILGTGSFSNGGILELNVDLVFPASIPFSTGGTVKGNGNLTVNNDFLLEGIIEGTGSLTVNGNMTWNSGTLDRAFTNQAGRTLTMGTSNSKTLLAPLVNDGTMTWTDGFIVLNVAAGSSFTNNSTFTMNGPLFQDNGGIGSFINNSTITKTSIGSLALNNFNVINPGTFNINSGSMTRSGGSFTNTGTINLNATTFTNGTGMFNHNPGSIIQGTGSFINGGILELNIDLVFPAAIPFSTSGTVKGNGNLTVNNDLVLGGTIEGSGTLVVNGNMSWSSGTLDRAFTNQAGRTLTLGTSNSKTLLAPLVNNGTMTWTDGFIVLNVAAGSSFTNNSTFTMNGPLFQDNGGIGSFINNAIITKTSGGLMALNNFNVINPGTFNINAGGMTRSGGSFSNTGTINLSAASFSNTSGTFHHNAGSMILGTGSFSNGGILELNVDLVFPAAIPFSTSGTVLGPGNLTVNNDFTFAGTVEGSGSLTVNGNTIWGSGTLDRTFTNQAGRTLTMGSANTKTLLAPLVNDGIMTWTDGFIVLNAGAGSSFTNNGMFTLDGPLFQDNGGTGTIINNGTITRSITGIVAINNFNFTNTVTGHIKGIGTITFGAGTFSNNGFIEPGLSSGILAINNKQLFSSTSILAIEVESNSGPGTGHDQLTSNMNPLTINGALTATLIQGFEPDLGNQYTVLTYPSRTGTFSSEPPCWIVTYNATNTTITYNPAFFDVCADDLVINTTPMLCSGVANYTISAVGTPLPTLTYTFAGATTGSGSGTGTGSVFNEGITTVTILADNGCSSDTCSFQITVTDIEIPILTCPANITVVNDPGVCGVEVEFLATATDNCAIESITYNPLSNSFFAVGTTIVTATATDVNGNTATCTFNVTVNDIENPAIDCPDDSIVSNDPGLCGAVVNYVVTSNDNCPNEIVSQTLGLVSGSTFPIGTTTNTFVVTDASGNTTTCSFDVIVTDNQNPEITCPDDIIVNEDPNQGGAIVNYVITTSDNCSGENLIQTSGLPSGSLFPVGTTTNTFEVEDASGNIATCNFDVIVVEQGGAPIITCPDNVSLNAPLGQCSAVVIDIDPIVSPPDTPYTHTLTGATTGNGAGSASGLSFNVGVTTVTYEVTGAGVQCSFTVTIQGTIEICNGVDDDCDGLVDDEDPDVTGQTIWFADTDGDGFGDAGTSVESCAQPAGHVINDEDCDDSDESINPTAQEICNGLDDDCDGLIDDDDPEVIGQSTWYADTDADGFGDPGVSIQSCTQPLAHVSNDEDCDDTNENIHPNAQEVCNGVDDDCDGLIDDDDPEVIGQSTWYADMDDDGYGDEGSTLQSCDQPAGYVSNDDDCDDANENINPEATEVCNDTDDDCDGLIDEGLITTWYADMDDDGYGDAGTSLQSCDQPVGYVSNDDDCDDANENINPESTELCNAIDDDCDGLIDEGCPPSGVVSISIDDATYTTESSGFVDVIVRLSEPSDQVVRVAYKTQNGTAIKGSDYKAKEGILRFFPGQVIGIIRIVIVADAIPEPEEFFKIKLSNPVNALLLNDLGFVFIAETVEGIAGDPIPSQRIQLSNAKPTALVVPNPQSRYVALTILGLSKQSFDVLLTDMNGRVMLNRTNYQNDWSMSTLSPGLYIYRVSYIDKDGKQIVKTGKLVIVD